MNIEENRIRSFINWPSDSPVDSNSLAKAGFFSTGELLEVQCHWCSKKISEWNFGDQALTRHRKLNALCPFVLSSVCCGNIPNQAAACSTTSKPINLNDLKNEQCRLATFRTWPLTFITPQALAKAGFYYFNESDQVKCAWCQGVVGQWEVGDNPFSEHQRLFPDCAKVQLGPYIEAPSEGIKELGIQQIRTPKTPKYSSLDARLRTFLNWPRSEIQRSDILAQAGFHYQGVDDQVRCFHCNGGLRDWLANDDPWYEHARWFPKCQFVQLVKGQQYIEGVQLLGVQTRSNVVNSEENIEINVTLEEAMTTEPVQMALQMGLHEGRIRSATKRCLEETGVPFLSTENLVSAVLDGQFEEDEERDSSRTSITREVSRILDSIFDPRPEQSTSTNTQTNEANKTAPRIPTEDVIEATVDGEVTDADNSNTSEMLVELSLEEENRKLKDARLCKVCMDDEVGVVFLPCGHLGKFLLLLFF